MESNINNPVTHPSHYTSGKIEVIDFITDQKLDFCLGNVVKYTFPEQVKKKAMKIKIKPLKIKPQKI